MSHADLVNLERAALLLIDMNRAHLDASLDYLPVAPEDARRVIAHTQPVLRRFRELGRPVCYIRTAYRHNQTTGEVLDNKNPFWVYQREHAIPGLERRRKSLAVEGSPVTEIVPELAPQPGDWVVTKKRYSGFLGTDLEAVLRQLRVEDLCVAGVNTNNCVLCNCFEAFNRDFRVFLLEDCCASMNGPAYHEAAVQQVRAALGWVIRSDELLARLGAA